VRDRPDIGTGAILEHFSEREEGVALQKLALANEPGDAVELQEVFLGAIRQLNDQSKLQRRDELNEKEKTSGLSSEEQRERWALVLETKGLGS